MKPADFFLDRRQFLGFLLPGALWIGSGFWLCGRNPFVWLEHANLVRVVAFVLASYVAGYVLQSAIFAIMDEAKRWRADMKEREARAQRRQMPWSWISEQRSRARREIDELRGAVRAAMKGQIAEANRTTISLGSSARDTARKCPTSVTVNSWSSRTR